MTGAALNRDASTREMLEEIAQTRQVPGEKRRRWFSSTRMDLVAWYDGDAVVAFQLCYDKQHGEHAITWKAGQPGLAHRAVDDGEAWQSSHPMRHKATPVLVPDGHWNPARIRAMFLAESSALPRSLARLVLAELETAAG